jgi:transposase-like protein
MRLDHFQRVLGKVGSLTLDQLNELAAVIAQRRAAMESFRALDEARGLVCCRHCGSLGVVKNGRAHGIQRYLCRDCGRTSGVTTNTPLARLRHKERLAANAACMAAGMTIRDTAAETGVAVSTAFRWRHRFLTAVVSHQPKALEGLLEVDETYFLHSRKGERNLPREARKRGGKASKRGLSKEQVPVLVARSRGQQYTADRVMPAMNGKELVATLRPLVCPDTVVCSDGNSAYYAVSRELGVTLKMFSASKHGSPQNPSFHVQTVNSYHSRLKGWLNHELRGVATKYLPNYLAWQRLQTWFKEGILPGQFIASALGRQLINT